MCFSCCLWIQVEALDTVDSEGTKYSATTTVEVTVTDVNEFAPVITAPLGWLVGLSTIYQVLDTYQNLDLHLMFFFCSYR